MANKVKIYSSLKSGKVQFDGARVNAKEIGSLEVLAHPTLSNRIIIKSLTQFKRGSDSQYRVFFGKLNINRVQNKAGQNLVADLGMDRDAVIAYVLEQITKPIITEYFEYNPVTDRLEANKNIEVNKHGFYVGGKYKMASGNSNLYFEDLANKANSYPVMGEVLDQSLPENQVAGAGYNTPKMRVFGDFQAIPLGGTAVADTSIPYDGLNFFPFNISGVGIQVKLAEALSADQQLKYEITVDGLSVYIQYLPKQTLSVNQDLTWYFDHPLDIETGTTLRATIYKVSTVDNQEQIDGILNVCEGDATPTRYQTTVLNRFFEDKDLELVSPYTKYQAMDFGLDSTGSTILLRDLSLGTDSLLQPHAVNTLEAVAVGTTIKIKVKGGAKVITESLPVSGCTIDGTAVNSVLNQAVIQLNDLFTNTASFNNTDTFVNSFALSGDDLTLGLNDGVSYTVDVTTLGVDENNFVASGSLNGTDLTLTMDDATTVVIDASSLAIDSNDVVQSGVINGNDLELTLSNTSVVTIDVSSLAVDTTLYVVSGTLSGTDLILTMSDSSTVTIDASTLAIDNDTTVTGGEVSGTDIILDLSDSTTITVDASTLGGSGSAGNPVVSGSVIGTDLVLVLDDATTVTIDASNMINGSTGLSTSAGWLISYGTNANNPVGSGTTQFQNSNGTYLYNEGPYYFGEDINRGSEFKFNMTTGQQWRLGIWDGAEAPVAYNQGMTTVSNWGTVFSYLNSGNRFVNSTNTDVASYQTGTEYVVANNAPLSLRFGNDGHLTLIDLTGGVETIIGKTVIALNVQSFKVQFGGWAGVTFPNGIISNSDFIWDVVHDFDNSENGVIDGVEDHTVIASTISIEQGEKIMFNLDEQGRNVNFGTSYVGGVSSGLSTAEEELGNRFIYMTNESINFDFSGSSAWNVNTNATYYFNNGAGVVGYRKGSNSGTAGTGRVQGMFSLRFNNDGKLTVYSEDNGEKIATAKVDPQVGSSVRLYVGYTDPTTTYTAIPQISKQSINQGTQPDFNFVPTVANQTVSVDEGTALNFQIVSSDNIVNQFVESDAPNWMSLNQNSGILTGTAPAYTGTSADTIVVNCKAGNAVGGTVDFTVTVTVLDVASYTNTKSLQFGNSSTKLSGNASNVTALQRASNGSGASDAWSISMWVYPSSSTNQETIFYYGGTNYANDGAITLEQATGPNLAFGFGKTGNTIAAFAINTFVQNQWNHVLVTYSGAATGVNSADLSNYLTSFQMFINGTNAIAQYSHTGNGYDGSILAQELVIGRSNLSNPRPFNGMINQVGIWDSDQSANVATIYNSGATQDLSLLAEAPVNYYEIENSITTISDISGSANLTGYNFSSSDLVSDTP